MQCRGGLSFEGNLLLDRSVVILLISIAIQGNQMLFQDLVLDIPTWASYVAHVPLLGTIDGDLRMCYGLGRTHFDPGVLALAPLVPVYPLIVLLEFYNRCLEVQGVFMSPVGLDHYLV